MTTIYPVYYGGDFKKTPHLLDVNNPYDGSLIAQSYQAGPEEYEIALEAALAARKPMAALSADSRYTILQQIAEELAARKRYISDILIKETAKPRRYAEGEIDRAVQVLTVAAEEAKRIPREFISLDWTAAGRGKEALVKRFPRGVIAGISPFNFPLNLSVHKIAPAIASGCPVILKPSSLTPLTILELAKIIDNTELPKGGVSVIPMDRKTAGMLVADERIAMLSFTGSPQVGWDLKGKAGKKKVALELGGNAGVIITKSCDMEMAVKKCVLGGFAYSGQVCIHAQRIFVEKSVFDYFMRTFVDKVKTIKEGPPSDKETEISVLIDEENARRVEQWVNDAVDKGARILNGGKRNGAFYEPTVLTDTNAEMKVCSDEIFGPVVTLETFSAFDEAVDKINDSRYGLQAGVFTNNLDEINFAYNHLEVGGVIINDVPSFRMDHMPYGGIKDSGFGREGVKYAIMEMTEPRLLVKNA